MSPRRATPGGSRCGTLPQYREGLAEPALRLTLSHAAWNASSAGETPLTIFNGEGYQVEPGLGKETVKEAGLVLHLPEPGLHQRSQLVDVLLGEIG